MIAVLDVAPGERFLDVGTGTGALAVRAARAGAEVVGADIAADQLRKARAEADRAGVGLKLIECDCQDMPLADESFDVAASAFGFVFAPDHARAGAELARVCRPGARLAITTWTYDEFSEVGLRLGREYPPGEDTREWSNEAHAAEKLPGFELEFEAGTWRVEEESSDAVWELMSTSVPPIKLWLEGLDERGRERGRAAYSECYPDGVLVRDYVLIRGVRR
jgi:SAM-dependent methyltransferase